MSLALTITGKAGPGNTVTAAVYSNLTRLVINPDTNVIEFTDANGLDHQISVDAATTVTSTKSGTAWTLVIS
jgi:hypothetical protein